MRSVFGEQLGADRARASARARAQVPLGVGLSAQPAFGDRRAEADRGQHVLQRLARAHVHVHVAGGDDAAGR